MRLIDIDQVLQEISKINFRELHIHHTYRPNHNNFNGSNHIRLNQNMRNYHVNTNGWRDIAQHLTLFPDGKFVTGRPYRTQPASIMGYNGNNPLCIEMLGDFDVGNDKLEGKQRDNLIQIVRYFIDTYGEQSIIFHRDKARITCPGTSVIKNELIKEAKALTKLTEEDVKRIVREMIEPSIVKEKDNHWVDGSIDLIKSKGIKVNEKRYDDLVTRGEMFAMISRII